MSDPIFDVTGAVAALNQTLAYVYPTITIVGELSGFKVSKGKWIYADLKDASAKIRLFGTVFQLPGPLEDGMMVQITAEPRLHPQFGFSLSLKSIKLVGEGSIKKAADLLRAKLDKEGLFALERKRQIPYAPAVVGLVASGQSAAYADFIKILNARWQGVEIQLCDVLVQGDSSPASVSAGVQYFNNQSQPPDVIVVIRGGGSADDLSAFSNEIVVRAVASSRVPTVVAIGHEIDVSLAELAADLSASTPSNAAELLFPDRVSVMQQLHLRKDNLKVMVQDALARKEADLQESKLRLAHSLELTLQQKQRDLAAAKSILKSVHPDNVLRRGYSIIKSGGKIVSSSSGLAPGDELQIIMQDGKVKAEVIK